MRTILKSAILTCQTFIESEASRKGLPHQSIYGARSLATKSISFNLKHINVNNGLNTTYLSPNKINYKPMTNRLNKTYSKIRKVSLMPK